MVCAALKWIVPVISVLNTCPDCPVTTPREIWLGTCSQMAAFQGQRLGKEWRVASGSIITQPHPPAFLTCAYGMAVHRAELHLRCRQTLRNGCLPELITCLCLIKLRKLVLTTCRSLFPCPFRAQQWLIKEAVAMHRILCLSNLLEKTNPIFLDKVVICFLLVQLSLPVRDVLWMDQRRLEMTSN